MTLKPYPGYKPSGASWLRDVPDDWAVVPAKTLFVERRETNRADDEHLTPSQKYGVLPQSEYMSTTGNKVVLNLSGADAMRHVEPRDFISHLRSFQGGLELSMLKGKVSAAYTVLQPRSNTVARYFKHLFKSTMYVQALQTTTDQLRDGQSIRYAQFARIPLCLPSRVEQTQIADYLDAHAAKIDALIGKQERLIETLAERRQAVISHAVTKGLDPHVPVTDTGSIVGVVPSRWSVNRLKNMGQIKYGLGEPPAYIEDGVPLIRATNVSVGRVTPEKMVFVDPADIPTQRIYWLRAGDIIVVRSGALAGDSAIIPSEYVGAIAGFDMVFRSSEAAVSGFIQYVLLTPYVKNAQLDVARIRAAQPHLNEDDLGSVQLAVPPIEEQREIVDYLDRETSQIDTLSAKAREMIDVLKERRQALISAAVTGKIDVRGLS